MELRGAPLERRTWIGSKTRRSSLAPRHVATVSLRDTRHCSLHPNEVHVEVCRSSAPGKAELTH